MALQEMVSVEDLVKVYPGGVRALAGVSFAVEVGRVLRLPGAERRRKEHDPEDPGDPPQEDVRTGAGGRT